MQSRLCENCKNYIVNMKCLAFPEGINPKITYDNRHDKPLTGQKNDIVFGPLEDGEDITFEPIEEE